MEGNGKQEIHRRSGNNKGIEKLLGGGVASFVLFVVLDGQTI